MDGSKDVRKHYVHYPPQMLQGGDVEVNPAKHANVTTFAQVTFARIQQPHAAHVCASIDSAYFREKDFV